MRSCTAHRDVVRVAPLGSQGFAEVQCVLLQIPMIDGIGKMYLSTHEIYRQQVSLEGLVFTAA